MNAVRKSAAREGRALVMAAWIMAAYIAGSIHADCWGFFELETTQ